MSNSTIATKAQANHINQRFELFKSSLSIEFKSYLKKTLDLTQKFSQGGLDQSIITQAFQDIEDNAKNQRLLLEKLLNWRLTSNELAPSFSIKQSQIDHINQQFERFKSPLSVQLRLSLHSILCSTHLVLQSRLDQSSKVQKALEDIEQNAKLQSLLLDKLLNWCLASNELDLEVSSEPSIAISHKTGI
ncbi:MULTISPECIES: hypothetical protein [unclassified Nostoc]|uniref:hypothetical protein n=1 Tax=unclassified Nostoc TaxID=2593658 RepID=UPI002AD2CC5D|nr:hypothetical protein [Nostoc sp. ChiQUE02]MDZ8234607.1 hypothetical protein [Nostoc sp. ChiQUE02]